jgi:acetate kinase
MSDALLLNAGSSSLDCSVFLNDGENAAPIRARVCRGASWFGMARDACMPSNQFEFGKHNQILTHRHREQKTRQ